MKKYLNALASLGAGMLLAPCAHAAEDTISKEASADITYVYSSGQGMGSVTLLHAISSDFRSGTLNKPKKLLWLKYEVASYPQAFSDRVELCYFEPYRSSPSKCRELPGGASDTTQLFNDLRFDAGAYVQIQHYLKGAPGTNLRPSGKERVTWKYSY
ncbi:hypothetical protein FOC84_03590 [Achromobacter pestifer]|uniref:Uncharacterized protein n=1 Tax=Achromobacter pestifer TaxID=1353889 RepID=A0A7D4DY21_9BURK|nr:hypothetical protein [Achromobacter pestifer]QKH34069.1 hypothetical protein FOC84_03590 [Achromobacter pestifer]